jgi:hypothetical protein
MGGRSFAKHVQFLWRTASAQAVQWLKTERVLDVPWLARTMARSRPEEKGDLNVVDRPLRPLRGRGAVIDEILPLNRALRSRQSMQIATNNSPICLRQSE